MLPEVSEGLVLTWWGGVDLAMVCHLCQLQGQAKDDDGWYWYDLYVVSL